MHCLGRQETIPGMRGWFSGTISNHTLSSCLFRAPFIHCERSTCATRNSRVKSQTVAFQHPDSHNSSERWEAWWHWTFSHGDHQKWPVQPCPLWMWSACRWPHSAVLWGPAASFTYVTHGALQVFKSSLAFAISKEPIFDVTRNKSLYLKPCKSSFLKSTPLNTSPENPEWFPNVLLPPE